MFSLFQSQPNPDMSTSRFNLSYDFVILSENSAQANDKKFVNILFDDLENTEERNIARFQLYLEEVLHLIIERRKRFTRIFKIDRTGLERLYCAH